MSQMFEHSFKLASNQSHKNIFISSVTKFVDLYFSNKIIIIIS